MAVIQQKIYARKGTKEKGEAQQINLKEGNEIN